MFKNDYKTIRKSGLFDENYYLRTYEDVRKSDINSLKHYIKIGWKEGKNPSESFNTNKYLEDNSDLKNMNICPLVDKIKKDERIKKDEKNKLLKNILCNYSKLKRQINKHNVNRLIYHIKKGNYSFINEKIGFYTNTKLKKMELNLIDKGIAYESIIFKKIINPKVSIIIPVYNQFEYTYKCLKSILNNTEIDYEVIIADDVSSDETVNILNYIKNITVVRNEKNLGFLQNCNNAAKHAKGEYLHFLNNDTQVLENWLSSLLDLIESDYKIGMVGSKLVYPDGRQQEAGGIIWNDASGWNFGRLDDPSKPEYNYVKEVDYISGASILIKNHLWKEIGGFDERYVPAYYEDSDLAFEVRKHGYKVMLQPKSVVVHFEGISNGTDLGSGIKKYQILNNQKFKEKWKDELEKNHFENAQNVFLARDRSKEKKQILFIDHYVPLFDQDAGSRATLHYLNLFVQNGFNVKFLGDNFYNFPGTPYVTNLEQMGIEVLYGTYYAENYQNWIKENGKYFDYIILSRPHISIKYIDLIKESSHAKIIYFAVDLHYLREERQYNLKKEIEYLNNSIYWKEIEYNLMIKADMTFCYSYIEVDAIHKENNKIKAFQIPLYIYDRFNEISYEYKNRNDILFVGGFSHTPNVDAVLWFIEEIFPNIIREGLDVNFIIVGSGIPDKILEYANINKNIIIKGRVSDEELLLLYKTSRLSVAPLQYGAGIKGKVVESLYMGIPLVTTSIGAEGLRDIHDVLIIADDAVSFSKSIIEIYTNEKLALSLSNNSIEYCKKWFSIEEAEKCIFLNAEVKK